MATAKRWLCILVFVASFVGGWHASSNLAILTAPEYAELVSSHMMLRPIIQNPAQICSKSGITL